MTIFFLIELKKSQKEQFIKMKQEDSELCFHGVMTGELSLQKAPQNKRSFFMHTEAISQCRNALLVFTDYK